MSPRPELFDALERVDKRLVSAGVPPLTPWWRDELRAFYGADARVHAARVGRGGVKSTTAAKCLTVEVLFGDWQVPPGERHWAINISENVDEARARLGQIAQYLEILGVPFDSVGEQILLRDMRLGFWTRAARIGATSGPRAVAWSIDEAAKLSVDGVNPAEELAASLRAASVTHREARGRAYSSPFGMVGYHHTLVSAGSDGHVFVSTAPTWVANPSLSEQDTRDLEPDARLWSREYAAVPQASQLAAFDTDAIERAMRARSATTRGARVLVLDPSSGRSDAWTWALVGWDGDAAGAFLRVDNIGAVEGRFWEQTSGDEIVAKLASLALEHQVGAAHGDQRESLMIRAAFARHGLKYVVHDWSNTAKVVAVERLRRWMKEGALAIEEHDRMRRELLAFEEKITASGALTFGGRGAHDDFVALLITAAIADSRGLIPRGEQAPRGRIRIIGEHGEEQPGAEPAPQRNDGYTSPGQRRAYERSRRGFGSTPVRQRRG